MSTPPRKKTLGIGLSQLLGDNDFTAVIDAPPEQLPAPVDSATPVQTPYAMLPLEQLYAQHQQPRGVFDPAALEEMAASFKEVGILQPLLVVPAENFDALNPSYQIIAGERRWRAAQLAQIDMVPCIVRYTPLSAQQQLLCALVENLQRVDLNPIEEAEAYQKLHVLGLEHQDIARMIGKSRPYISNMLRLIKLPSRVRQAIIEGRISVGHAKLLVSIDNAEKWLDDIEHKDLTVRQLERALQIASKTSFAPSHTRKKSLIPQVDIEALASELSAALGATVFIKHRAAGTGVLHISYSDCDQLEAICKRIQYSNLDPDL